MKKEVKKSDVPEVSFEPQLKSPFHFEFHSKFQGC